jgi:hypothetical protein
MRREHKGWRSVRLSLIPLCLCQLACAGHAQVTYRGAVLSADRAHHAFVDNQTSNAVALSGAHVSVAVTYDHNWRCAQDAQEPKGPSFARTETAGTYEVWTVFGSMIWSPDHIIVVCVSHPEHHPYEYRAVFEKTPRSEKSGTRFLNFYLRKK